MFKVEHFDFCIIGSGVIVNRLLRVDQFSQSRILIISDQMSTRSDLRGISKNTLVLSRKHFVELKSGISVGTLIVSAKTHLWPNDLDFDLILRRALECQVSRVIQLSSGSVYGESSGFSKENSDLRPVNSYGRQKLLEEESIRKVFDGKSPVLGLRISNVYGDSAFQDFINRCIESALKRNSLEVFSNGTLHRDFLFVDNLIQIIGELLDTNSNSELEYLNISSGKRVSIAEVITKISHILSIEIKQLEVSKPSGVVQNSLLDNSKLNERISWVSDTLEEGLTKYIVSQFPELTKPL
jgi:nucleoside-diphosphate-sugar epimerase